MSNLALSKNYGDLELLFKSDVDVMWEELEAKINGNIDNDNVVSGWASFAQVSFNKDVSFYFGLTESGFMRFYEEEEVTTQLGFSHVNDNDFLFKIDSVTVLSVDHEGNASSPKDLYFANKNTTYPLSYLIGYSKPVLVYVDSTTVNVEQNTTVAGRTLIIFPNGPIHVTEDVSSTHKFRQLKLSATANGYATSHTGAADSGMKVGLTLAENTYYFVYAVIVRGGDDAGNNFILVVDDTNPMPVNWATLDTSYGEGNWVYLGLLRYGHGEASSSTLVPFLMDKSGWTYFTGRAAVGDFFGVRTITTSMTETTYDTIHQFDAGNEGNSVPENCSMVKMTYKILSVDLEMLGNAVITDSTDNILYYLPSFSVLLESDEAHGFEFKVPNGKGIKLRGKKGTA